MTVSVARRAGRSLGRLRRGLGLLALGSALLVACSTAGSSASGGRFRDDVGRGADIAAVNCGRCHDIGADGSSPHPLAPSFGVISERYPLDYLRNTLEGGPDAGHLGMPAIEIEDPAIEELKSYIRSLKRR